MNRTIQQLKFYYDLRANYKLLLENIHVYIFACKCDGRKKKSRTIQNASTYLQPHHLKRYYLIPHLVIITPSPIYLHKHKNLRLTSPLYFNPKCNLYSNLPSLQHSATVTPPSHPRDHLESCRFWQPQLLPNAKQILRNEL